MFALLLRQGIRRRPLLVKLQSRWSSKYESNKTDMTSDVKVKELLSSLSIEERRLLYERLRQVLIDEEMALASASSKPKGKLAALFTGSGAPQVTISEKIKKYIKGPTSSQLVSLFAFHSLPYVAFGCMDNCIMILTGDYIESTIGSAIGISTMASAALGNTMANSTSIAVAYHVERLFTKNVKAASSMSVQQFKLRRVRLLIQSARIIGIITGCFIGMTPLLFFRH